MAFKDPNREEEPVIWRFEGKNRACAKTTRQEHPLCEQGPPRRVREAESG